MGNPLDRRLEDAVADAIASDLIDGNLVVLDRRDLAKRAALEAVLHGSAGRLVGAERRGGVGERPTSDFGCSLCPSS